MHRLFLIALFVVVAPVAAWAQDFHAEVMTLVGNATATLEGVERPLKEGDLLQPGEAVNVSIGGYVDIAFDADWKNVARLDGGTSVQIISIVPGGIFLKKGEVFSQLHALPSGSTFEIQTPTAVAAVRGSVFDTTHENDVTEVQNYSDSVVEVFSLDESGAFLGDPVFLEDSEKTRVFERGQEPEKPEKMAEKEVRAAQDKIQGVKERIEVLNEIGRKGLIQDVERMSAEIAKSENPKHDGPVNGPGKGDRPVHEGDKLVDNHSEGERFAHDRDRDDKFMNDFNDKGGGLIGDRAESLFRPDREGREPGERVQELQDRKNEEVNQEKTRLKPHRPPKASGGN